jgi:chorismate mutase
MGREKRIKKAIESLKRRVEEHFDKLEKDIVKGNEIIARYHIKEIDRSLIDALEKRMELIGEVEKDVIEGFRMRLKEFEKKLGGL